METMTREVTRIQFNKRYLKIITSYLEKNSYTFSLSETEKDNKVLIEINGLNPEDAFYLGVNTQVQLVDGEILI